MENKTNLFLIIFKVFLLGLVMLGGLFFLPWQKIKWGEITLAPSQTITVVGEAKLQRKNQIAIFNASVNVVNYNKETAVTEVNKKIEEIIKAVKDFGIKNEDIKTQNVNVYQREETYYEEGRQKTRPGQWSVSNSLEIKLRDVDRASSLATLLTKSGANNVWGPNFTIEEPIDQEKSLLEEAVKNAKEKAENIAKSQGKKLGQILSITEGHQTIPIFPGLKETGGGGIPVEPGSSTISKTVTVVFELK